MLKTFDKKYQKIIKKIHDEDPLRELGPGIVTYHQLLVLMMALFFVLMLLHIPVYHTYAKNNFYQGGVGDPETHNEKEAALETEPDQASGFLGIQSLSLGNMGFSKTECHIHTMMPHNKATLRCNAG